MHVDLKQVKVTYGSLYQYMGVDDATRYPVANVYDHSSSPSSLGTEWT